MLLQQLLRKTLIAGLVGLSSFTTAYAAISQVPLYLTTAVKPNVMLMLDDSGSMWNIVPDAPYDPNATYLANCPASRTLGGGLRRRPCRRRARHTGYKSPAALQ
jgi:type IV pilus assembly protein PilY1